MLLAAFPAVVPRERAKVSEYELVVRLGAMIVLTGIDHVKDEEMPWSARPVRPAMTMAKTSNQVELGLSQAFLARSATRLWRW